MVLLHLLIRKIEYVDYDVGGGDKLAIAHEVGERYDSAGGLDEDGEAVIERVIERLLNRAAPIVSEYNVLLSSRVDDLNTIAS